MRMISDFNYENVEECDDSGYLGGLMGWNLRGHLDLDDVEEFLICTTDEGYRFAAHFDVEQTYCRKVPTAYGYRYAYTDTPGRGAYPVTSVLRAWLPGPPSEMDI